MPAEIAAGFVERGGYAVRDADLPDHHFDVSLHWSWRFEQEPAKRWLRELVCELFQQPRHREAAAPRSEEHTSELQSRLHLVCRLLLEKKKCSGLLPPNPCALDVLLSSAIA